jgi:hypothetical protein
MPRIHWVAQGTGTPKDRCSRAFCVPKFEVGGPPRELWATTRGIFFEPWKREHVLYGQPFLYHP